MENEEEMLVPFLVDSSLSDNASLSLSLFPFHTILVFTSLIIVSTSSYNI
jgi:Ca2+/H+ antiporter